MSIDLIKQNTLIAQKTLPVWFDTLSLPVAPECNMVCNFCSKCNDCISNGNDPEVLSKVMSPRQAVKWAKSTVKKNQRVKVIKISGPGEPLYNPQTFEVLRRLSSELPDCIYSISTNGLLLKEKVSELIQLNVKLVDLSINALNIDTISKLYSKITKDGNIIATSDILADALLEGQIDGLKACIENGISININSVYMPGINEQDIYEVSEYCKTLGVKTIRIIAGYHGGKLQGLKKPDISCLASFQNKLLKVMHQVEVRSFLS